MLLTNNQNNLKNMEIKDQKIIDTLADTLGVPKENLSGVRILSKEEQAKKIALLINTYFKENFLKRIESEVEKATKLKDSNHLLTMLSDLLKKAIAIKDESPQIGLLFELAEQLGAIGYSIFVADKIELNPKIVSRLHQLKDLSLDPEQFLFEAETLIEADWVNFINSKKS